MRKIFTVSALVLSFTLHAMGGFDGIEIPEPSVQIARYREVYKPYVQPGFNPETTPIVGLGEMLKTGCAYVPPHLKDPTHQEILRSIWAETEPLVEKGVTISDFKLHNLRLAMLLSEGQERSKLSQLEGFQIIRDIFDVQDKWNIGDYKQLINSPRQEDKKVGDVKIDASFLKAAPYPFCFEAIIYDHGGELSLQDFNDNFLNEEFAMGLAGLPVGGEGPHSGYLSESASFFMHDLIHWNIFAEKNKEDQTILHSLRGIHGNFKDDFTQVALFIMLHEYPTSVKNVLEEVNEKNNAQLNGIFNENLTCLSQRTIFRQFSTGGFEDIFDSFYPQRLALKSVVHKKSDSFSPRPLYYEKNFFSDCTLTSLSSLTPLETQEGFLITSKLSLYNLLTSDLKPDPSLTPVSLDFSFEAIFNSNGYITWNDMKITGTEGDLTHPQVQHYLETYTNIFKGSDPITLNPVVRMINEKDIIKLFNYAGVRSFKEDDTPAVKKEAIQAFGNAFYLRYKDFFSDAPLEPNSL